MSVQQEKFKAIADRIRMCLLTDELIKPNDFADRIDDVYLLGDSNGYAAGIMAGMDEGIEQGKAEVRNEMFNYGMSLSEALTSGDSNIEGLEANINQAKSDITAIKTLIENHGVEVPVGTLSSTYDDTIEQIIDNIEEEKDNLNEEITEANTQLVTILNGGDTGGKSYYDEFWDSYQDNGNRTDYRYGFAGSQWTKTTMKPKYKIAPTSMPYMFDRNVTITKMGDLGVEVDFSNATDVSNSFSWASNLQEIEVPIATKISNSQWYYTFYYCTNLKSIKKLIVLSGHNYSGTFTACNALTDVEFEGVIGNSLNMKDSPLSKESIESIIGCLSATATGKTLTLKKTAVNTAFGIDVDDEATYPEGSEYYNLRHSKDNWTISYV